MPTLLSDPPSSLYLVFFVLAVITGAIAFRYQERKTIGAFALAAGLLLGLWQIDYFFESPREQAVRGSKSIQQAMNERNPDALLANVSESFDYNGKKKKDLRTSPLWHLLNANNATVETWDFSRDRVKELGENMIQIGFMAKGKSPMGELFFSIEAVFVRDPDGQFRVKSLKAFEPVNNRQEQTIPF